MDDKAVLSDPYMPLRCTSDENNHQSSEYLRVSLRTGSVAVIVREDEGWNRAVYVAEPPPTLERAAGGINGTGTLDFRGVSDSATASVAGIPAALWEGGENRGSCDKVLKRAMIGSEVDGV